MIKWVLQLCGFFLSAIRGIVCYFGVYFSAACDASSDSNTSTNVPITFCNNKTPYRSSWTVFITVKGEESFTKLAVLEPNALLILKVNKIP